MNMFKKTRAKTAQEYLAAAPKDRAGDLWALHRFIKKTVPGLKPYFAANMLGYGKFKYLNYKKQTIDWPVVALANQKQYISLYVCALEGGKYLAEKYKSELGKVKVGRSCIGFKKMADLNLPALAKVLKLAAKHPGLAK